MTVLDSPIPRFHLAMPVDDLAAARSFYGYAVDGHDVPVPFGDDSQVFTA
jgi:hypothetical protein